MATNKVIVEEGLQPFLDELKVDAQAIEEQRELANEDTRFVNVPGGMWEGFKEDEFENRAKLEFDLVSGFLMRFLGEWNQNRVGVEYKPDDSDTSDDDAELLNGMYRADYRNFSGKMSVDNAVDEVATSGYGAFQLVTEFVDNGDPENELQRIGFLPIHDANNTVIWDSAAKKIDKSDARHCVKLTGFTDKSFKVEFPDDDPISAYNPDTSSRYYYDDNRANIIYIATRYQVIEKKETVFIYNDLANEKVVSFSKDKHKLIEDELKADPTMELVRERKITNNYVEKTVFSGKKVLREAKRIAGNFIPIIPIYGYRSYVNGMEWYRGLVRKLKDAARMFNMQVSQLAENSASAGQEVPIFTPDQMDNASIKAAWADKNNKSYLLADAVKDSDGNPVAYGPVGYSKPPQLDGSTSALMQIVPGFIQNITGGAPQDTLDPDVSGKAINALRKREDLNTQVIQDNIANSLERCGTVYQSMASDIYTTARMVTTIGKDGTEGRQELLKTVMDEETGRIIEANNLTGKKFRVYADIGPQYDSQREQTVEELKGMAALLKDSQAGARYMPAVISLMLENISGVGLDPLKKMVRQDMLASGMAKPENDEEKAIVAQAQQPKEDATQELIKAEAQRATSESRSLDASSIEKVASAKLKEAQTAETLAGIEMDQVKTQAQIREQVFKNIQQLPLQTGV